MTGKSSNYLSQLYTARSEGDWGSVRVLSEKVRESSSSSEILCAIACIEAELMGKLRNGSALDLLTSSNLDYGTLASLESRCGDLKTTPIDDYCLQAQLIILHSHILLLQGEITAVIEILHVYLLQDLVTIMQGSSDDSYKYLDSLIVKGYAILGVVFEARGDNNQAFRVYEKGSNYIKSNYSTTNSAQSITWSEVLLYRLASVVASVPTSSPDQVRDVYRTYIQFATTLIENNNSSINPPENFLVKNRLNIMNRHYLYLSSMLSQQSGLSVSANLTSELEEVSKSVEKTLLKNQATPKATDSNAPVESYIDMILQNWSSMVNINKVTGLVEDKLSVSMTEKIKETIYQAIERTFHSRSILCHLVTVTLALGQYEESLLAFQTYLDYEEQHRIHKQSGAGDLDVTSSDNDALILKTVGGIIHLFVHVKRDGYKAKALTDKLKGWINTSIFVNSKTTSSDTYNRLISSVYSDMGAAYYLYSQQSVISEDRKEVLVLAIDSYQNALSFDSSIVNIYFDYALLLAKSDKITEAITIVKQGLIIDKTQVSLWHLLALLLSSLQSYDAAYKIICNALDNSVKGVHADSWCDFPDSKKEELLQLKITQVALIEAYQGISKAIEAATDVFAMYGKLYTDHGYNKEYSNNHEAQLDNKPNRVSGTDLRLVKTMSRVSKVYTNVRKSLDKSHQKSPDVTKSSSNNQNSQKFLRLIWLWTSALYRRGGLLEDSEQAIVEAESISLADAASRVQLGLLIRNVRPNDALKEFELALEEDPNNLSALLALSLLVMDHIEFGVESDGSDHDKLFISRYDSLVAKARVQVLLRQATSRGNAQNSSEAWLLLSRVYEQEGDIDGMRKALWRSIELEECRGVRNYDVVVANYS